MCPDDKKGGRNSRDGHNKADNQICCLPSVANHKPVTQRIKDKPPDAGS